MARTPQASLDDSYRKILIQDFSGGMVTNTSPLALGSNQSPDMLNVIHLPGRLFYRGGYVIQVALPFAPDAAYPFYDANGGKHYAVWAGGNLYDVVTGAVVLVNAACYTAGQRIGHVDRNGILYWSTGQPNPVPLRFWSPSAGTSGAVISSGTVGTVAPPASDFLFMYLDSIVALAPTWAGAYQPNVMAHCATGDPTTWVPAVSQAVGTLNSGRLEFGRPFGIAASGVPPFQNIIVGRDDMGVWAYSGALGSLQERLLNCPVGVRDRDSVQYLPTAGDFGTIVWLADDGQVWSSNGINAKPISDPILPTLASAYEGALANNVSARFYSGYNQQWQYYWLDVGGTQFVYRWATNSWTKFQGWPTGPSFASFDGSGRPAYFVASSLPMALNQIALMGVPDNGAMPSIYWKSPVLHGGDFNMFKDFHWAAIATYDTAVEYTMEAESTMRQNGSQMVSNPVELVAPGINSDDVFIIGQSLLGGPDVLGDVSPGGIGTVVTMQGRFAVPVAASQFMPEGQFETLKGTGAQITISHSGGANVFDLLGVEVLYVPKGYRRGSGTLYNPEALTGQPFDPYGAPTE